MPNQFRAGKRRFRAVFLAAAVLGCLAAPGFPSLDGQTVANGSLLASTSPALGAGSGLSAGTSICRAMKNHLASEAFVLQSVGGRDLYRAGCSSLVESAPTVIGMENDDAGVAIEDEDTSEIVRPEIRQSACRIDRATAGLRIGTKAIRAAGSTISSPLLE